MIIVQPHNLTAISPLSWSSRWSSIITTIIRGFSQTSPHKATPATFTAGIRPSRSLINSGIKQTVIIWWGLGCSQRNVIMTDQIQPLPMRWSDLKCLNRRKKPWWQLSKVDMWRRRLQHFHTEDKHSPLGEEHWTAEDEHSSCED